MEEKYTLEDLLDDNYMCTSHRCLGGNDGVIEIESIPDDEYRITLKDGDDEETDCLDCLCLNDIEELANDMIDYVKLMRTEIKKVDTLQTNKQ